MARILVTEEIADKGLAGLREAGLVVSRRAVLEHHVWQRFTMTERMARFSIYFAIVLAVAWAVLPPKLRQNFSER